MKIRFLALLCLELVKCLTCPIPVDSFPGKETLTIRAAGLVIILSMSSSWKYYNRISRASNVLFLLNAAVAFAGSMMLDEDLRRHLHGCDETCMSSKIQSLASPSSSTII